MKRVVLMLVFALAFLFLASFAQSRADSVPDMKWVQVTLVNQDPNPAEPGKLVTLRFKIENLGGKSADDVYFKIIPQYPFSLYSDTAEKFVGSIGSRQVGAAGAEVKYKLKVDEGAVEGENKIIVEYKSGTEGWAELPEFNVTVQSHEPIITAESIIFSPEIIEPGKRATLNITIKNLGLALLKDIRVNMNVSSAIPVAPINSINEIAVGQLEAGQKRIVSFDLIAEPEAKADLYQLPITILYNDRTGENHSKNYYTALLVGGSPKLMLEIEDTGIYTKRAYGKVTVKFINHGLSDIKLLSAYLKESDNYEILSSPSVYVGKIDSDDYETADFNIYVKKAKDKVLLPLTIIYMDANNNEYFEERTIELPIYSAGEAAKFGLKERSSFTGIIITLIIIVGGVVAYKKWWKKRKKK